MSTRYDQMFAALCQSIKRWEWTVFERPNVEALQKCSSCPCCDFAEINVLGCEEGCLIGQYFSTRVCVKTSYWGTSKSRAFNCRRPTRDSREADMHMLLELYALKAYLMERGGE